MQQPEPDLFNGTVLGPRAHRPGARIAWLGAEITFGGHEKFILCEFERSTGAREIYPTLDEMNKVRSKNFKGLSGRNRNFKRFFRPKTADLQKIKKDLQKKQMKKRSSSQKRHKIQCQSTKNTNLGLELRSRSPETVNFFGAQSSLGGAQFSFGGAQAASWGARPRYAPRGAKSTRSDGETFFFLHLYLAGRSCENPQSARGPARCKYSPARTK